MTIGKKGAKLRPSGRTDTEIDFGPGVGKPAPGALVNLRARRYSMAQLVQFLSGFGGHGPGIDQTGLTGVYDFTLSWDDANGPTLETALAEQLGLRMTSAKVPSSYFVIDSAQRPTGN